MLFKGASVIVVQISDTNYVVPRYYDHKQGTDLHIEVVVKQSFNVNMSR